MAAASDHWALVGRDAELATLLERLSAAVTGRGGLVLLGGEPGIGKTRLADELAASAASAGARVLWGRCWEAGGAPAYWPWIQALRGLVRDLDGEALAATVAGGGPDLAQLLPELRERLPDVAEADPASPEVARFRLFDTLSGFLDRASEITPLLLTLEDLHAADAPSLLLLRFVADDLTRSRMLVLGTYRDAELSPEHALAAALPELVRLPATVRVPLAGLSQDAVARFIETITGLTPPPDTTAAIHRETGGNPLFIGELARLLVSEGHRAPPVEGERWPVPAEVREVIGRRLERLTGDSRRVLSLASVVGRDFTVEALAGVTGRALGDLLGSLHHAAAARLVGSVAGNPRRYEFTHGLVRDTLYEDLEAAERTRAHRIVGEVLEHLYADDPEPHVAELAHHFLEARDPSRGIDYAVAAGRRALSLLAYEEAIRLFQKAYRALRESPDEQRRCEVLLLLGDAQARSGLAAGSKETFLEAAEIATRLDQPEHLAHAALGYGGRFELQRAGIDRHLVPLLRQALEAVGDGDSVLRVRLLSRLAGALRDQPSPEPRTSLAREAVAMARRMGDPDTLTRTLLGWWAAALLGPDGLDRADAVADELDRLAHGTRDRELRANATWVRFVTLMTRGQVDEARAQHELVRRLAQDLGQPPQQWYGWVLATVLALQDGRFADAERLVDDTYEAGRRAQPWDAEAARLFALFQLRREQGRLAELEESLRKALGTHPGYRSLRCMLVTAACDLGRTNEARASFQQLARDGFAGFPKDNEWLFALTLLAEAAEVLDERAAAAVLYEQLTPYAGLVGLAACEVSVGPVTRPLGILAGLLGHHADAAVHFEDALEHTRRMRSPPWQAHARHAYAAMLATRGLPGDHERAVDLLTGALEVCEHVGMPALGQRVTGLLARLGARPRRRRRGSGTQPDNAPDHSILTRREREVAGLLAEGLTNRQIAERLYVSERTAETHVQHLLTKLGYTSRSQVAVWATREGLNAPST